MPEAAIGYSLGETVSLLALGAWTGRDEMLRRMHASSLFSCDLGQKSFETRKLGAKGHGVFFYYVLQGLNGEAKNKKGEVNWDRLVVHVKENVPEAVKKHIGDGAEQSPNPAVRYRSSQTA